MRVLVTGAAGMLGATIVQELNKEFDVYATGKSNYLNSATINFFPFDLSFGKFEQLLEWASPNIIIHCAAITNLDYCEQNQEETFLVNSDSVKKFLDCNLNPKIIFISSESVFPDGLENANELDQTGPINIYGKSKQFGENYIIKAGPPHLAIRTTLVGKNLNKEKVGFVEWIINSLRQEKEIMLFRDQFFNPITIWSFTEEIKWLMQSDLSGIIHIAGKNPISKYEFGINLCNGLGLNVSLIKPGSLHDFPFLAKRAADQTIDSAYYSNISKRDAIGLNQTIDQLIKYFS